MVKFKLNNRELKNIDDELKEIKVLYKHTKSKNKELMLQHKKIALLEWGNSFSKQETS